MLTESEPAVFNIEGEKRVPKGFSPFWSYELSHLIIFQRADIEGTSPHNGETGFAVYRLFKGLVLIAPEPGGKISSGENSHTG